MRQCMVIPRYGIGLILTTSGADGGGTAGASPYASESFPVGQHLISNSIAGMAREHPPLTDLETVLQLCSYFLISDIVKEIVIGRVQVDVVLVLGQVRLGCQMVGPQSVPWCPCSVRGPSRTLSPPGCRSRRAPLVAHNHLLVKLSRAIAVSPPFCNVIVSILVHVPA